MNRSKTPNRSLQWRHFGRKLLVVSLPFLDINCKVCSAFTQNRNSHQSTAGLSFALPFTGLSIILYKDVGDKTILAEHNHQHVSSSSSSKKFGCTVHWSWSNRGYIYNSSYWHWEGKRNKRERERERERRWSIHYVEVSDGSSHI